MRRWTTTGGGSVAAHGEAAASGDGGDAAADATTQEAHGEDDEAAWQAPTKEELRERYARDRKIVEYLAQQGIAADDPVRIAAEQQAANAKAALQGTSPGVAVTTRLVWAEQALRRARKAQAKMEQTLSDLDDEYERKRSEYVASLHELRGRTREREEKLAVVSREAALEFQTPASDSTTQEPLRHAMGTIEGPLRDAVQEALDQAPMGSALHTRLSGALGALSDLRGLVVEVARPRWADFYDLAEDDEEQWQHNQGQWYDEDGWYEGGDQSDWWTYGAQPRRSTRHCSGAHAPMDTADVQVPSWMCDGDAAEEARSWQWDGRAWKRGRRYSDDPNGVQGRNAVGAEVPMDHEAAAHLQAMVHDGTVAAAAAAAQSTAVEDDAALDRRKREVWDQAQCDSVAVSYETIASMDAATLEEWASTNLL